MKERVAVAMSGGVDSSVAAALLKEEGYDVIGVTMRLPLCGQQGIKDARSVARKLDIKHHVVSLGGLFRERVIKDFCRQYLDGRTPNPCVRCNQFLKFGALLERSFSLGAKYIATGHYARIEKDQGYFLKKARDINKDQSYFLYRLSRDKLKNIIFPLGNYTKNEVRVLAGKFGLPVAAKSDSQEICFLAGSDYRGFLKAQAAHKMRTGQIVDIKGNILGSHKGIAYYTVGQREGLGIALGYPVYVTRIDAANNRITVGTKEEASRREFTVKEAHFIVKPQKKKIAAGVKIRYNHREMPAQVLIAGSKMRIKFQTPQFAITPGQSAVLYHRDIVLGGGIIDEVFD